jgi:O-antigen/teichoic acid export membrane protein
MNAGSNWVSMLVLAVVGLVLVRIIYREVGPRAYGVWALLATGLRYPMILERAFVLAINRLAAFYRNDIKQVNRFVSASFIIMAGLAGLTVIAAILLSYVIPNMFSAITDEFARDARITCILVGVTLALKMLEATFSGALQGYQYYTYYNIVVIVSNLFRAALTIGLLVVWKNIIAFQSALGITAAVSAILMFFTARKSIAGLSIDIRLINKNSMRELWQYTSHSLARSGSSIFMYSTMALLIGWFGTDVNVAVYDIAQRIPSFIRSFLASTQVVFLPAVSDLWAKGRVDAIRAVIKKGTRISSVLACAIVIFIIIFTERILLIWLPSGVPEITVRVMQVLMISVLFGGLFEIWLPALVGMGHLRGLTIASIASALIAILLALTFIIEKSVSIPMAPALALTAVILVKTGIWLPLYGLRKLGIGAYEYLKESLYQPLAASLVSIAGIWILKNTLQKFTVHWSAIFAVSIIILTISFTAISLRNETVDFIAVVKKRFKAA